MQNATKPATAVPSVMARKRARNFSKSVAGNIFNVMHFPLIFMSEKIQIPLNTISRT